MRLFGGQLYVGGQLYAKNPNNFTFFCLPLPRQKNPKNYDQRNRKITLQIFVWRRDCKHRIARSDERAHTPRTAFRNTLELHSQPRAANHFGHRSFDIYDIHFPNVFGLDSLPLNGPIVAPQRDISHTRPHLHICRNSR